MGVTRIVGEFIKDTDLDKVPDNGIATAKDLILDTIGVALAASEDAGAKIAVQYARNLGGTPVSSVMGSGLRTSATQAALCNGILAHCLEFEDAWPETIHPSSMVFPAALAVAEQFGRSGKDLLGSYIVGLEVLAKIATASPNITHTIGWHGSSVYGALGAAAAVSKVLDLDVDQICAALGLAASGASGLIRQHGTMAKWWNQGNAARQGVEAAMLSMAGFTADREILEGTKGFMPVFHPNGGFNLTACVERLGKPFHLVSPGASVRKYPCAYVHQGTIDSLRDLLSTHRIPYEDVAEVIVPVTPQQVQFYDVPVHTAIKKTPRYVLAVALRYGDVKRTDFTEERVKSPDLQEALKKIRVTTLNAADIPRDVDPARYQPDVIVRLTQGPQFAYRVPYPPGRFDDPTPKSEFVLPKFRDNAAVCLSSSQIEECIDLVRHLDELGDLADLMNILRVDDQNAKAAY